MSNTLLIHIGTPKTGTSALQDFFNENKDALKKYNWCYPDMASDMYALGVGPKKPVSKNGFYLLNKVYKKNGNAKIIWKYLLEHLKRYNVIVTDERFWDENTAEIITEAKKHWDNIKVIVYLRRQDLFLESKWAQTVKAELQCEGVFDFPDKNVFNASAKFQYLCEYRAKLESIENVIGADNIIVRPYERQQLKDKDISRDFLHTIGIDGSGPDFKDVKISNESLSGTVLELKRMFNTCFVNGNCKNMRVIDIAEYNNLFIGAQEKSVSHKKLGYMSVQERTDFCRKYEDENRLIAQKYMNREDGILFMDDNYNIEEYVSPFSDDEKMLFKELFMYTLNRTESRSVHRKKFVKRVFVRGIEWIKTVYKRMVFSITFRKIVKNI